MLVYLDNSSTTRQYAAVTLKMLRFMEDDFGNPSSLHRMGLSAENALKEARGDVAKALGFEPREVFFTSGGTEAANLALLGAASARKRRGNRVITSSVEHPAVFECCKKLEAEGFTVIYAGVDEKCRLNLDEVRANTDENTILISIMHVNNEVGAIMPLDEICRRKGDNAAVHTDAVQAFGKLPQGKAGADIVTVSAHKIHGPKGCGAIAVRKGINLEPRIYGGGQEKDLRSGTENVAAIAGFGEACRIAASDLNGRAKKMDAARSYLLAGMKEEIPDIRINSAEETSLTGEAGFCAPSILNVSFLGARGEVILHGLESEGIFVSTGAACSSHKKGKNRVLAAMGLSDKEAEGAIRFSFNEFNSAEEMDYVLVRLKSLVSRFRKFGGFR